MFSKAKRFEPIATKTLNNGSKKPDNDKLKNAPKSQAALKTKQIVTSSTTKSQCDNQSQTSSTRSIKFITPKPVKTVAIKSNTSIKKITVTTKTDNKAQEEIIKAQEVEIKNKDHTISEYNKHIEELKTKISDLQKQIKDISKANSEFDELNKQFCEITLDCTLPKVNNICNRNDIDNMGKRISELENQCVKLQNELSDKQVDLSSLEDIITIRDSLCKDLQDKLSKMENTLQENYHRLEMVKGHHALALEANDSIRREYKAEIETLKAKLEEEKQSIFNKSKTDQEAIKSKYTLLIDDIKNQITREKEEAIQELRNQMIAKDVEMKAKLEQIDEATQEKLKICEIQFEERTQNIQDHCEQQQKEIEYYENETKELRYHLNKAEESNKKLQQDISNLKNEIELSKIEKLNIVTDFEDVKEETKKKLVDYENEINKLTVDLEKLTKDKNKFEMSLSVTRDIVQVLTMRLRESDNELEHMEGKIQTLTNCNNSLENELTSYKNTLNNTVMECNEYKEALVNILKSKAALAKEHNRIMEHNVSLIESLQNVEKEAYRELGSIKSDLLEDVELLKKESNTQIKILREEVEKKRVLCEMATEHAGQATVAAEQSRVLLAQASVEIARLEAENQRFEQQIQDQQSLVVELSLLRQENEELTMTVAKQSSIIDKLRKDSEQAQKKSPSLARKNHKIGKENGIIISPLRERNH